MIRTLAALFALIALITGAPAQDPADGNDAPLRIAVIGLVHGHVEGVLWNARERDDLEIVGIYDPDPTLFEKYKAKYNLDDSLYSDDLGAMLDETEPEAASVMTSIKDHMQAVEACATRGVHTLVEKPLAISAEDAREMKRLADEHDVLVLTNYETSWYTSVRTAKRLAEETSPIRRAVFRHGHKGPVEIGCTPEFLDWLTDPDENGGGAVIDFGCYGANIMTWLMNNERPSTVSAILKTLKPDVYPNVDDDATIVLTYDDTVAVIQGSWAWTHDNKDMDLYTTGASYHAQKWDTLEQRNENQPRAQVKPDPRDPWMTNEWSYLRKVVRGECDVDPLSSIENNLIVCEILDAARESAKTGRTITIDD